MIATIGESGSARNRLDREVSIATGLPPKSTRSPGQLGAGGGETTDRWGPASW
jgi:hypothetical protein